MHTKATLKHPRAAVAIAVLSVFCVALAGTICWTVYQCRNSDDVSLGHAIELARFADEHFELTGAAIANIPASGDSKAYAFSLSSLSTPHIDEALIAEVDDAVANLERDTFHVSCILININSGRGIAVNPDQNIFSASTIKAPYCTFILSCLVDTGEISSDIAAPEQLDQTAARNNTRFYYLKNLMQSTIRSSSNSALDTLSDMFGISDYRSWLTSLGCGEEANEADPYMHCSSRTALCMWNGIYHFLQTNTPSARFMKENLANTNRSWIRDGIKDTGAQTWNKAGWIFRPLVELSNCSSSDNAIIELDGETYLMSLMTSGEEAYGRAAKIAKALFACRNALGIYNS